MKVIEIQVKRAHVGGEEYAVKFASKIEEGIDMSGVKEISLSRIPDHCFFSIATMSDHDSHTPRMYSKEEGNDYIKRICKDIVTAIAEKGVQAEVKFAFQEIQPKGMEGLVGPNEVIEYLKSGAGDVKTTGTTEASVEKPVTEDEGEDEDPDEKDDE